MEWGLRWGGEVEVDEDVEEVVIELVGGSSSFSSSFCFVVEVDVKGKELRIEFEVEVEVEVKEDLGD